MRVIKDAHFLLFKIDHFSCDAFRNDLYFRIEVAYTFKTVVHGKFFRSIECGIIKNNGIEFIAVFEGTDFSKETSAAAGCHIKRFGNGKGFKILVNKSPAEF